MAAIREELVLADRFSATFTRYLGMMRQSTSASAAAAASQKQFDAASGQAGRALVAMAGAALDAASAMGGVDDGTRQASESCERASRAQDRMNDSMRKGRSAASGLESRLLSLAKAYASLRTAQAFVGLTDTFTQTTARLERMNDGLQSTGELQDMIYQAAQRSRGAYQDMADMVSKLGTQAGTVFNSNEELVAFSEQISKQFSLMGTPAQQQAAAMLQLTQAMSAGVLRGEELNSILDNASGIARAIEKYMGWAEGSIKQYAEQGLITAQVVKNALFEAAKDTNKAFEDIPLTFGQAWTLASNKAIKAMEPAMTKLKDLLNSDLGRSAVNGLIAGFELLGSAAAGAVDLLAMEAQWVADNGDIVQAVLLGIAAAAVFAGAQMSAAAIQSAIAWAAANWPLLLIAAGVALVIYMARQMGYTWEEIGGVVGGVFGLMYAFLMNSFIVPAWNHLALFANFLGNLFVDPVAAVKLLFLGLAEFTLGKLSNVAHALEDLINKIPGVQVNLTSGIDSWYNKVRAAAQQVKSESDWIEFVKPINWVDYSDAWNNGAAKGGSLGKALDDFSLQDALSGFSGGGTIDYSAMLDSSGMAGTLDGIKGDTAAIKRSVSLSEEDMKLLVDVAERRYVNNINLTAQTPVITINGQNTGDTAEDLQWLENALIRILREQAASHTDMSYA